MRQEVRPLTRKDSPAVLKLVAEIEQAGGVDAGFYWPQKDLQEEIWITEGWGAFLEGQLQAFALYREAGPIWEVTVLATALSARKQGWMGQVLRALVNAKGQTGEIWLEVHEKNLQAQKLYEKLGFRAVGERPKYYRDGARAILFSYSFE